MNSLVETEDGRSRQGCIAKAYIPPDEASMLLGMDYTITIGGRVYDSQNSVTYVELPPQDFTYYIPMMEFVIEELDEIARDRQVVSQNEFYYDVEELTGEPGEVVQRVASGFEINPDVETANDMFGFFFEMDAPEWTLERGSVLYQFVTFRKAGDFTSDPITVGCSTKLGDPYQSQVDTFVGIDSMASTSSVVVNRTWYEQNEENVAPKAESFSLLRDVAWYSQTASEITGNVQQPCLAVLDLGRKLASGDDIFGTYDIMIGARMYYDDEDTEPFTLPEQRFQVEFVEPEFDLERANEEVDQPEEAAETLPMFNKGKRFDLS